MPNSSQVSRGRDYFRAGSDALLGRMPPLLLPYDLYIVHYILSSFFVLGKHDPDKNINGQLIKGQTKIDKKCIKNINAY